MARPSVYPKWDETETNTVAPDATHENTGFETPGGVPEKPKYQHFNYWMNLVWKWIVALVEDIDGTNSSLSSEAQSRVDGDALAMKIASNGADIADDTAFRTNIDVYNKAETEALTMASAWADLTIVNGNTTHAKYRTLWGGSHLEVALSSTAGTTTQFYVPVSLRPTLRVHASIAGDNQTCTLDTDGEVVPSVIFIDIRTYIFALT